jgi:predicted enzyme related to lactoylglutathione lyase
MTETPSESAQQRTYPHGVPCWVESPQPDPGAAAEFYRELFGWTFSDQSGSGGTYLVAALDGRDVAAVCSAADAPPAWQTSIATTDAEQTAAAVTAAGGTVLTAPFDAGSSGRAAVCADPAGAVFRLWQAVDHPGAQVVNHPGSWNFSHLHAADQDQARQFYSAVFGWQFTDPPFGGWTWIQVPGYGDHLAATVDPGIHERQAQAPKGFADVVGGLMPAAEGQAYWQVTFSVADREAAVATAGKLGATVLDESENRFTKLADLQDRHGARFTVSQFLGVRS